LTVFNDDNLGKDKGLVSEAVMNAARKALTDGDDNRFKTLADLSREMADLEEVGRGATMVKANAADVHPGTLYEKLEAGDGIEILVQAPASTAGLAAQERIVRISGTGIEIVSADSGTNGTNITTLVLSGAGLVQTSISESPDGTAIVTFTGVGIEVSADSGTPGTEITSLALLGAGLVSTAVVESPNGTATVTFTGAGIEVSADSGTPGTSITSLALLGAGSVSTFVAESPNGTATVTFTGTDTMITTVQGDGAESVTATHVTVLDFVGAKVTEDPSGTAKIEITSMNTDTMISNVTDSEVEPGTADDVTTLTFEGTNGIGVTVSEDPAGTATVVIDGSGAGDAGFVSSMTFRYCYKETSAEGPVYASVTETLINEDTRGWAFYYHVKIAPTMAGLNDGTGMDSVQGLWIAEDDTGHDFTAGTEDTNHDVGFVLKNNAGAGLMQLTMQAGSAPPAHESTITAYIEVEIRAFSTASSETDTEDGVDYDYVGDGHV